MVYNTILERVGRHVLQNTTGRPNGRDAPNAALSLVPLQSRGGLSVLQGDAARCR